MKPLRVGVVDEHDIYRRGIIACLTDDESLRVTSESASGPIGSDIDVAVMSAHAAENQRVDCPVVVCLANPERARPDRFVSDVAAFLDRATLTPDQLVGAVHAAAAGLRINSPVRGAQISERGRAVLKLLAEGADTHEISQQLGYSERTIKSAIQRLEHDLGVRTRAQAVAEGIRSGLI